MPSLTNVNKLIGLCEGLLDGEFVGGVVIGLPEGVNVEGMFVGAFVSAVRVGWPLTGANDGVIVTTVRVGALLTGAVEGTNASVGRFDRLESGLYDGKLVDIAEEGVFVDVGDPESPEIDGIEVGILVSIQRLGCWELLLGSDVAIVGRAVGSVYSGGREGLSLGELRGRLVGKMVG